MLLESDTQRLIRRNMSYLNHSRFRFSENHRCLNHLTIKSFSKMPLPERSIYLDYDPTFEKNTDLDYPNRRRNRFKLVTWVKHAYQSFASNRSVYFV